MLSNVIHEEVLEKVKLVVVLVVELRTLSGLKVVVSFILVAVLHNIFV